MTNFNILVILALLSLYSIIKAVPLIDSPDNGEQKRAIPAADCLESLYILAFTTDIANAGSDVKHGVTITLTNELTEVRALPTKPTGRKTGDLWTLSFESFFPFESCIKKCDIKSIAITERGDNGWNIQTIVTFVKSVNGFELATRDFDVERWIQGDKDSDHKFELSLVL